VTTATTGGRLRVAVTNGLSTEAGSESGRASALNETLIS
jgi:hypothetical protein